MTPARAGRPRWGRATLVGTVAALWFAWLAVGRWNAGLSTSYDLGIFAQSADDYAHGRWPRSQIRGLELLGDHFSPIMALNALPWSAWPDPRVLLLTQAVLLGTAVAGVVAFAVSRGVRGLLWLLPLLLARGLLTTAMFDVHEVMYAAPLVVVLAWAVAVRRLPWALVAGLGLVLTKEDLGATVAAAGAAWWLVARRDAADGRATGRDGTRPGRGRSAWRAPMALAGLGAAGIAVAFVTIAQVRGGSSSYLGYFGGDTSGLPAQESMPQWHRVLPLLLFAISAGVVGLRSPLALLAVPTLAWRVLSSSTHYWSIDFHYDLVPTLVGMMALVDVLGRRPAAGAATGTAGARRAWTRPVLAVCALASLGLGGHTLAMRAAAPANPFVEGDRVQALRDLMERVPAGERVVTGNGEGAYLVPRWQVATLTVERQERGRWLVYDLAPKWRRVYPLCARSKLWRTGAATRAQGTDLVLVRRPTDAPLPTPTCTDPRR